MKLKVVFYKYWKYILFSIIAINNIYCNEIKWRKDFCLNVFEVGKNGDGTPYLIGCDEIYINDERIYMRVCEKLRDFVIKHYEKYIEETKHEKIIEYLKTKLKVVKIVEVKKIKKKNQDESTGYYYICLGIYFYCDSYENYKKRFIEDFNIGISGSEYEVVKNSELKLNIIDNIKIKLKDEDKDDIEKFKILLKHQHNEYFDKDIQILKEEISKLKIDDSFDFNKVTDFKSYIIEYIKNTSINDDCYGKKEEIVDDIIKLGYIDEEINKKIKEFKDKRDDVLNKNKEDKEEEDKENEEDKEEKQTGEKPAEEKPVEKQEQIRIVNQKPEKNKDKKQGNGGCCRGCCNC